MEQVKIDPKRVCDALRLAGCLFESAEDSFMDVDDDGLEIGQLEYLVHEVIHGASLDLLPFTKDTPSIVSDFLGGLSRESAIEEEAFTLAVEWALWDRFGFPWDWNDLVCAGEIQEVEEPQIKEALGNPRIHEVADKAYAEIVRLAGMP